MLLIVTNRTDYTADLVILELKRRGLEFFRFNTEDFPLNVQLNIEIYERGFNAILLAYGKTINLSSINSVWYRRPKPSAISDKISDQYARDFAGRECSAAIDGLWRILPAFWVSNPERIRCAESKMLQLLEATRVGLTIPQTLITTIPDAAKRLYESYPNSLIYKPLRYGYLYRNGEPSSIFTNVINGEHYNKLESVQFAPSMFQPYIDKQTEFRVTVVGSQVFSVEIDSQKIPGAEHDWRRVEVSMLPHKSVELPHSIAEKCVLLTRNLGLEFGAIDLILTPDSQYVFLEINPNGQWGWVEHMCPDLRITDALVDLLNKGH